MKSIKLMAPGAKEEEEALELSFATEYNLGWNDQGSGADNSMSVWIPKPPFGYFSLGHVIVKGYDKPKTAMFVVKPIEHDALATPTDYKRVWGDWGSGSDMDGSFWEPIPPAGYKAMGIVVGQGYDKPKLDAVACVRSNLVVQAAIGKDWIWGDWGSGADGNVTFWPIVAPENSGDSKATLIVPGGFCGHNSYDKLVGSPLANCFRVELPLVKKDTSENVAPKLSSMEEPPIETKKYLESVTYIPCTTVVDSVYKDNLQGQAAESPFYKLEKYAFYRRKSWSRNGSDKPGNIKFTNTVGISKEHEKTITDTIGISATVGYSSPGDTGGPSASITFSYSFSLAESWKTAVSSEKSFEVSFEIPANGVGALYGISYEFRLIRKDGTCIASWEIDDDGTQYRTYP